MSEVSSNLAIVACSFTSQLSLFLNNSKFSDIILILESERFFAHKILLYFRFFFLLFFFSSKFMILIDVLIFSNN